MEIVGGIVNCTVIISDEMIGSPIVRSLNSLMAMNRASKERFESQIKPHGLFIMNTSLIKDPVNRTDIDIIRINATDIAEELGNVNAANMVMLGALIGRTGIIKPETVSNAMKEIIPKHRKNIIPLNETAFKKGLAHITHNV
ncbi:MAG: 2-oxoacid:acceptor oxidoreductase family protein [Candidatus Mariimomonas ferrooxydans]